MGWEYGNRTEFLTDQATLTGRAPIPRMLALAVEALEHRQQAVSSPKRPA